MSGYATTLDIGAITDFSATIQPTNATNQNVTWTSSAPTIVAINTSGRATALSAGTAVIIATATDGGHVAMATITVLPPAPLVCQGVVINGVRWATRNVGAPGQFVTNPEDPGMLFQWNRIRGWAAGGSVSGWNSSTPTGTSWERENDPCPPGWRLPTDAELRTLFHARCYFTTINGRDGCRFGTALYHIFMPVVGARNHSDGALFNTGIGFYWSSTQHNNMNAMYLDFSASEWNAGVSVGRAFGLSVRCVAEIEN